MVSWLNTAAQPSGNEFVFGAGDMRSNIGPVKTDTMLPTARYRCDISLKGFVLPGRNDAKTCPANSLHTLV